MDGQSTLVLCLQLAAAKSIVRHRRGLERYDLTFVIINERAGILIDTSVAHGVKAVS